jgi:predicted chitinase
MECSSALAAQYESLVNESLRMSGATSYARVIMWLAQMGHESLGLQAMTERGSNCRSYEGRRNLGNTQPGDG